MSDWPKVDGAELSSRIATALEQMCFIITDPTSAEELGDFDAHSVVSIGDDVRRWEPSVPASSGLLAEIAAGLMGLDPDELDPDDTIPATAQEIANIFSGIVITMIGGEDHPYHPGIPTVLDHGPDTDAATTVVALNAMGDGLLVTLTELEEA